MFARAQSLYQYHEEYEYLLHNHPGIHSLQGIRDNRFTRFVVHRGDVGCPENRSHIDEEGGISHTPSKTNSTIKVRDYENVRNRSHRSYYLGPKPC